MQVNEEVPNMGCPVIVKHDGQENPINTFF